MLRLARVEAYDTGALCFLFAFGSVAVLYQCRLAPRTLIDDLLFLDPVCWLHAGAHCSRLSVTFIATLLCELVFACPSRADPRFHVIREPPTLLSWTFQDHTEEDSSSQSWAALVHCAHVAIHIGSALPEGLIADAIVVCAFSFGFRVAIPPKFSESSHSRSRPRCVFPWSCFSLCASWSVSTLTGQHI